MSQEGRGLVDADEQRNVSALSSILPQSVLAALQSSNDPEVLAYLSTPQSRGRGGRGFGRGQMGRGRGGRGRGNFSIVTCLRCGMLGHSRTLCTSRAVQCGHCKADHLDALCPLGPGGAQRDALSAGAKSLLDEDVSRQKQQSANAAGSESLNQMDDQALAQAFYARFPHLEAQTNTNEQSGSYAQQFGFFAAEQYLPKYNLSYTGILMPIFVLTGYLIVKEGDSESVF